MFATPVIPGRLYRVSGSGVRTTVIADNPVAACLIGLRLAGIR